MQLELETSSLYQENNWGIDPNIKDKKPPKGSNMKDIYLGFLNFDFGHYILSDRYPLCSSTFKGTGQSYSIGQRPLLIWFCVAWGPYSWKGLERQKGSPRRCEVFWGSWGFYKDTCQLSCSPVLFRFLFLMQMPNPRFVKHVLHVLRRSSEVWSSFFLSNLTYIPW